MDRYLEEVEAIVKEEASIAVAPNSSPPPRIEIDYQALRNFYHDMLPAGQRPNFSAHLSFAWLQKERDLLDILTSRLRVKLDELAQGVITSEQFLLPPAAQLHLLSRGKCDAD